MDSKKDSKAVSLIFEKITQGPHLRIFDETSKGISIGSHKKCGRIPEGNSGKLANDILNLEL